MDPNELLSARSGIRCSFDCSRSEGPWYVRHAVVHEALARTYHINLSLVTDTLDLDPDKLVGATCEFAFDSLAVSRRFHGVILRVFPQGRTIIRGAREALAVGVEVVPALAMLGQRINCRIFQDMTVPEILRDVLLGLQAPSGAPKEGLAAHDRTLDDEGLVAADYEPPRDYCVQYRESDLDFLNRLMYEEGIVYVFDQTRTDHEVLKLIDREGALPVLESTTGSRLAVNPRAVEHIDVITHFTSERTASPKRVETLHYNWLGPVGEVRRSGTTFMRGDVADNERDVYIPSERRVREVYAPGGAELRNVHDETERRLAIALQQLMGTEFVGRGSSNACGLGAGMVFEIDHESAYERLVALEVVHQISMEGDTLDVGGSYENHFVCVPSVRFRAASIRAPRPVIHGPQTAKVTGSEDEDIHTDQFGRIKILMHWDREGEGRGRHRRADASSSVWVRVAQAWAGHGWGAMFIPRVGMEVLVEFLDGNPDRPVVTGCLYNGSNPPPYTLPQQASRSTIRTKSTPDNGGFNELRFEDAAGAEEVYLHGQKDWTIEIENDKNQDVGHDETLEVGHDRSKRVGHDENWEICNDQTGRVGHDQTLTVGHDQRSTIQGNRTDTIRGNAEECVAGSKTVLVEGMMSQTINEGMATVVGEGTTTNITTDCSLSVGGNSKESVMGEKHVEVVDRLSIRGDADVVMEARRTMTFTCGEASITLRSDGTISIRGVNVNVRGSGNVVIRGQNVAGN